MGVGVGEGGPDVPFILSKIVDKEVSEPQPESLQCFLTKNTFNDLAKSWLMA